MLYLLNPPFCQKIDLKPNQAWLKQRSHEMSISWNVSHFKCRSTQMSVNWSVSQSKCLSIEMSVNWNVCQLKCRSIERSHYQNSSFSTGGPKMLSVTFKRHFCPKLGIFFLIQNEKKIDGPPPTPLSTKSWKGFHDIPRSASFHLGVISISSRIPFCLAELKGLRVGKKRLMLSLNRVERFYEQMKNSFKALISLFK